MSLEAHQPEVLEFLHRDPLRNIVHLKVLSTYAKHVRSFYFTDGDEDGVLFLLPTKVTTYESVTYPETEFVVYVTSVSPHITALMLDTIPTDYNLIFKFTSAADSDVFKQHLPLQRYTGFLNYTCAADRLFTPSKDVVISKQLDKRLLPLFHQNGYQSTEIETYFAMGKIMSFTIFENGEPVSTCLAYENYGPVWEIGMVYTAEAARRKGYGRVVVETAVSTLLKHKHIPRYQMDEKNLPSKALAERIGLQWFMTTEHYLYHHK